MPTASFPKSRSRADRRLGGWLRRVAAAAALFFLLPALAVAAEVIERYESAVTVNRDGVLDVTETITVRAEGVAIKRGIYRDFPLIFLDEAGDRRRVSFQLVGVTRNGKPEPYHTQENSDGVRIYAGKEDVFLSPGTYTYKFHYRTGRQIRFLAEHTELFWNVTGNEWAFPIQAVTARIRLPENAAPVRWTAYTGYFGDRGTNFTGEILGDNTLEVRTTRILGAQEGLSVVVQIPDGLVAPPSGFQKLYYQYLDNRNLVLGILGFLGVLLFYLLSWNAVGRDPPKGTIIPLFHPPKDISPALAAYVRNWGWSGGWREFTAAAVSLAVKGLIVFDDSDDKIVLKRTKAQRPGDLPPGERTVLDWIEKRGDTVRIDRTNGPSLAKAQTAFRANIEKENRNRFFKRNAGYFAVGVILTVLSIAVVLFLGDLRADDIALLVATAFVGVVAGAFIVPTIRILAGPHSARSVVTLATNAVGIVVIAMTLSSLWGNASQTFSDSFANSAIDVLLRNGFPFLLVGGFAAMNGLFYYLLKAPTAAGRVVMDQIEGLELYIRTAETNRLNLAGAPDLNATQFERILPYAIALDAEKPWSDAFASAFARAHPAETVEADYRPAWHSGRNWSGGGFSASMASVVSAAQASFQSAVPAPSSSSSGFSGGGGGGSGGGGGGGGGGGW